jgi:hypothetical protein
LKACDAALRTAYFWPFLDRGDGAAARSADDGEAMAKVFHTSSFDLPASRQIRAAHPSDMPTLVCRPKKTVMLGTVSPIILPIIAVTAEMTFESCRCTFQQASALDRNS